MKEFFEKNKIFIGIIVGALITGGAIIISNQGKNQGNSGKTGFGKCVNIPELPDRSLKLATKIIDGDTFLIEGGYSVRI
ncbi:MAG: hypothetical protein QME61_03670 [Patescibacteria group bacterium]|nr:hypothetical protein [Patescibacteria group bacterium]